MIHNESKHVQSLVNEIPLVLHLSKISFFEHYMFIRNRP